LRGEQELRLKEIIPHMTPVDLVIVEGFKHEPHPKLEIYREAVGKPLLHPDDNWIVALASDGPVPQSRVPVLYLDDIEKIADVLLIESVPVERLGETARV
jgi:molybdopterin-guanine dinucleotide biosynthesis protein B